jgi:hypothetical protein
MKYETTKAILKLYESNRGFFLSQNNEQQMYVVNSHIADVWN